MARTRKGKERANRSPSPMKKRTGPTAGIGRATEAESNALSYGRTDDNQDVSQSFPYIFCLQHLFLPVTHFSGIKLPLVPPIVNATSEMASWLILRSSKIRTCVPLAVGVVNCFVATDAGALFTSLASIPLSSQETQRPMTVNGFVTNVEPLNSNCQNRSVPCLVS